MAQMVLNQQVQNGTAASLSNHTLADMELIKYFSFSGQFIRVPEDIKQGHLARFIHLKGVHGSSCGGVIYSITGSHGEAYAVLLAWDAPANVNPITSPNNVNPITSPNKLLGICGPKASIESLDEATIRNELDKAGSTFEYIDEATKIVIHANIAHNPRTNMADLFANFQLKP